MAKRATPYLFVIAQFTLLLAIVLTPGKPTSSTLQLVGLVLLVSGLTVCVVAVWQLRKYSLTALPTPIKNAALLDSGLYSLARHPIYTGLLATMSGVVMARFSLIRLALLLLLVTLLYEKSKFEETELTKTFGKRYKEYMTKTRRFL